MTHEQLMRITQYMPMKTIVVNGEEWRLVDGYEYYVSNIGRVWSVKSNRIMSPCPTGNGYLAVSLWANKKGKKRYIHQLVATAFIGKKPSDIHEVAHANGKRNDNRAENLRWATRADNFSDKASHGTETIGEKHPCAKLTEADVLNIRDRCKKGECQNLIAKEYGVGKMTISRAVRKINWSHI